MSALTFQIPLQQKPRLRMIGRNVHGHPPIERFRLQDLWCLHLYCYHACLSINGVEVEIKPGDLGVTPANADVIYWYQGRSEHLYAHFELPVSRLTWAVPALYETGEDFHNFYRLFEEGVGMFPRQPLRAEVRLWDLLWHIAGEQKQAPANKIHPVVNEVIRQIELRLHEPLLVEALAREVGFSHNHLARLFQTAIGKTVKGYMQERRMEKILHLLKVSSRPIKNIAGEVGFQDLHAFNKAVKRYFGKSPRELRNAEGEKPRKKRRA